jgi:hypothetical protein
MPTIHTLFITTQPLPPLPPPSTGSSPKVPESKRLSLVPFTSSQMSHDLTEHSQSTEASNVIPPSPLDPRVEAQPPQVTATAATAAVELVTTQSEELTIGPPVPPKSPLQRVRSPITPIRSQLGEQPLPTPPSGRPASLPKPTMQSPISTIPPAPQPPNHSPGPQPPNSPPAFSPPSIPPSTDPSKVSLIIYLDDQSAQNTLPEYRVINVPKAYTIADLKDLLSDRFVMPAYLQELWIDGRILEEDADDQVLEAAGVTHGVVVVLSRAGV